MAIVGVPLGTFRNLQRGQRGCGECAHGLVVCGEVEISGVRSNGAVAATIGSLEPTPPVVGSPWFRAGV